MELTNENYELSNGIAIPKIFFGTYQIPARKTAKAVEEALKIGYPGIDTARVYENEQEVGDAIAKSDVARESIFLTTKIPGAKDYDEAKQWIDESLEKLQTDHIDLMLFHWPSGNVLKTYRAMEDAYKEGKLKSLGISNFYGDDLNKVLNNAKIQSTVDQVEANVFRQQRQFMPIAKKDKLVLEAWSPLARAHKEFFANDILKTIAKAHGKTIAQVGLRFLLQLGFIVLPRSTKPKRMEENINIFDFELTPAEMDEIKTLDTNKSQFDWR